MELFWGFGQKLPLLGRWLVVADQQAVGYRIQVNFIRLDLSAVIFTKSAVLQVVPYVAAGRILLLFADHGVVGPRCGLQGVDRDSL